MHGRNGYVCGIDRGFRGEYAGIQNAGCEEPNFGRDVEHWEVLDYPHPFQRSAGVACTGFIDDKLRDANLEPVLSLLPPFLRSRDKITWSLCPWRDSVVPLAVKFRLLDHEFR